MKRDKDYKLHEKLIELINSNKELIDALDPYVVEVRFYDGLDIQAAWRADKERFCQQLGLGRKITESSKKNNWVCFRGESVYVTLTHLPISER